MGLLAAIAALALVAIAAIALYEALVAARRDADRNFGSNEIGVASNCSAGNDCFQSIVDNVNPLNSTKNCGYIIDAVIDRLTGTNPSATAPDKLDGGWPDIEARHNTTISWNKSFDDAFNAVRDGGDGTIAIVGIQYENGSDNSHVLVLANHNGEVGILEGQDWGSGNPKEVVTTPERANERYNGDGNSIIGYGIVGKK